MQLTYINVLTTAIQEGCNDIQLSQIYTQYSRQSNNEPIHREYKMAAIHMAYSNTITLQLLSSGVVSVYV